MMSLLKSGAVAAVFALASCQSANVAIGTGGGGTGVAVSTTVGQSQGVYFARNNMRVVSDPNVPGRFEVLEYAGRFGKDYWCAAGQYTIEHLNQRTSTRLYLEAPFGPGKIGRGKSVGFAFLPSASLKAIADAQSNELTMSSTRVGENWSAEHGRAQCPSIFGPFLFLN